MKRAELGRKIGAQGQAATWVALDDWHIIGPWDNTGRRNLTRQFPPESVIDLDATYLGKRDKPIRWEFINTNHALGFVSPTNPEPYGIWYGVTEINLDEPRDLWVAIGSDDRGTLWINGQQLWVSSPTHKSWNPTERRLLVPFKAGRNQILVRCENGHQGMGFSVMLHLGD